MVVVIGDRAESIEARCGERFLEPTPSNNSSLEMLGPPSHSLDSGGDSHPKVYAFYPPSHATPFQFVINMCLLMTVLYRLL